MLESAYRQCLAYELREMGLSVKTEVPIPIFYKKIKLDYGYRIDLLVEDIVVLELKAKGKLNEVNEAQTLTCMRFAHKPVGLLIDFNNVLLKNGIRRLIM